MLCLSAVILFGHSVGAAANSVQAVPRSDEEVAFVAKASLAGYLDQIPAGREPDFGFRNREDLLRAEVGVPISVLGVRASVGDSIPGKSDSGWNRIVLQDRWRVPVEVDGKPRVFVTVERLDGVLQAVDFGGASLAQEIGEFEGARSVKRKAMLRLDGLRCDVLVLDRTGSGFDEGEYRPLRSARNVFGSDTATNRSRKEMFETIHRKLRQNLLEHP